MEKQTQLKVYDILSFGTYILLGLVILTIIISAVFSTQMLSGLLGVLIISFWIFDIIFWFSMVRVCDVRKYPHYFMLVLLAGLFFGHVFYFKVYRKTLK